MWGPHAVLMTCVWPPPVQTHLLQDVAIEVRRGGACSVSESHCCCDSELALADRDLTAPPVQLLCDSELWPTGGQPGAR